MAKTKIHWCDYSLNFYSWSCKKVSAGCKNCYMFRMAAQHNKTVTDTPAWREKAVVELRGFAPGTTVFVNDMSDTYIETAPVDWIAHIHDIVTQTPAHIFLLLTKRPQRALAISHLLKWPENLWLGVSVEGQNYTGRIDLLRRIPARHRFISFEPLLGTITANLRGVEWAIVGGESGANARYMDKAWARDLLDQCRKAGVPYFFKQASGHFPGENRTLLGSLIEEYPPAFAQLKQRYQPDVSQMELF